MTMSQKTYVLMQNDDLFGGTFNEQINVETIVAHPIGAW